MDGACHYCESPAEWAVTLRSGATETAIVQRQRLCEAHDAIVSSLASITVLDRRPWHALPPDQAQGTIIEGDRATIAQTPTGARARWRSLVGR